MQLQGDGRGFDCIVILAEDYEIMAMKCIVNLCRIVNTHHALGVAGAVDVLVEKLKKQTSERDLQFILMYYLSWMLLIYIF